MIIQGFQKLTLLDYPGKIGCTVFTPGCNFKCPFCHNARLVRNEGGNESVSVDEILDHLTKRQGVIQGLCITGGEPTLQKGLEEFASKVKALGYCVKLDTNGSNPDKLYYLIDKGLVDYVAMDIKNSPEKYPLTAGVESLDMDKIEKSARILMDSGISYEFRTTVTDQLHTKEDIHSIGRWLKGAQTYCIQNYKDSGDILVPGMDPCSDVKIKDFADIAKMYFPNVCTR